MKIISIFKKVGKVFLFLIVLGMVMSIFSGGDSAEKNTDVKATTITDNEVTATKAAETPTEIATPKQVATPEETPTKEELSDGYKAKLKEQEAEETSEADNTQISGTTIQLSESKKEELIGYVKEYSDSDEVKVSFISSSNPSSSSDGLVMVDYYLDVSPTKNDLDSDLASIVILSQSVAKESGITNADVSVVAMLKDGTSLGVGNYYSSTGKTDIDVTISDSKTAMTSDTTNTNSEANYENSKSKSTTTSSTVNTDSELIYASSESDKYHSAGCSSVKTIKPENLITFSSRKEAEKAGYVACKKCGG